MDELATQEAFCKLNNIRSFGLSGSALRENFGPGSDIKMLGQKVDLIEHRVVEESENYICRCHILKSVKPIYVTR